MRKITAIIPCFNEEKQLRAALESVKWADEIMVVDSYSTDKSLEIAREYTDFIIQRTYENSASQKNWAIPQANNDWILLLDADEILPQALQDEIQTVLRQQEELLDAYWMYRDNFFMGKKVHHVIKGDKVIRLFKKTCRYKPLHVHSEIETEGLNVGRLEHKMEHRTFKGIESHLKKVHRYALWSAKDYHKKTKKITLYHLWIKPFYRFIKHYFIERGFLDGKVGFILSSVLAWSVFLRYWYLIELRREENG